MNIPSVAVTVVAYRNIPVVVERTLLLRPLFVVHLCRDIVRVCLVKVVAIYIVLFLCRYVICCSGMLSMKPFRRSWIFVDCPVRSWCGHMVVVVIFGRSSLALPIVSCYSGCTGLVFGFVF